MLQRMSPGSPDGLAVKTINYGIIGCGMMGQEHLRNIALLDGARAAAIFEPNEAMAAAALAIAPSAELCGSLDALLGREDLDCLLVASPNHCHVDALERIAATRPLPLLMEKPLYTDSADLARVEAVAARYPAPIWVAMEYRYMPPIQTFLHEVQRVTGGVTMLSIREHRFPFLNKVGDWNRFNRTTGGTLVEKCCHFFDLMRLILGSDPVRISASAGQMVNHLDERYGGRVPDVWDSGYVTVDFASGARAMLELCMYAEGARFQEEISAVGPNGKLEVFVPGPGRFWPAELGDAPVAQVVASPRAPKGPRAVNIPVEETILDAGDHNGSTYFQHARFIDLLRRGGVPEVGWADGAWAVRMGLAAQEAARSHRVMATF
ncbi:Gfo/Idh/MocA family oxidoreductase [Marivita sp. GX14005]|uniref:Gfo/Idh/MocA family protein n=1 Tax=Marivita sp. GX14005 TaxID=2942276 RepID=UPI0020186AD0|nr:Gfo/Idh/MocA family oxidoreductase [Marivita sp. GX14005]MCL3882216.1 Gfo/Idh/MocA family oxidoreductase [Marivita sp. GX14005]